MIATIDEKGFLVIRPETSIERFALACWQEKMQAPEGQRAVGYHIDMRKPPADGVERFAATSLGQPRAV